MHWRNSALINFKFMCTIFKIVLCFFIHLISKGQSGQTLSSICR